MGQDTLYHKNQGDLKNFR